MIAAVTGCAAAAVLAGAIPAHAEGSFSSSMSAVRTGDSALEADRVLHYCLPFCSGLTLERAARPG